MSGPKVRGKRLSIQLVAILAGVLEREVFVFQLIACRSPGRVWWTVSVPGTAATTKHTTRGEALRVARAVAGGAA